jgi:hypothetical protein
MRLKTRRLLQRGSDLRARTSLEISATAQTVAFGDSARKIVDDVFIDFQSRAVLYAEGDFELPHWVNMSLNEMRKLCVAARQQLAGQEPRLSEPLDRIEQACGRFVHRHPSSIDRVADMSKPLAADVLDDLLQLRLEIAEVVDAVYRETGLPSAQALLNRIEFDRAPESPWPG